MAREPHGQIGKQISPNKVQGCAEKLGVPTGLQELHIRLRTVSRKEDGVVDRCFVYIL